MAKKTRVRDYDQFIVRLPEGMREKIAAAAEGNGHSMNAEMVSRLEESFDPLVRNDELAARVAALNESERIRELQALYLESLTRENEALRKAGIASERLVFLIAHAIQSAARGDDTELKKLVEREKDESILKKLTTVWSIVGED